MRTSRKAHARALVSTFSFVLRGRSQKDTTHKWNKKAGTGGLYFVFLLLCFYSFSFSFLFFLCIIFPFCFICTFSFAFSVLILSLALYFFFRLLSTWSFGCSVPFFCPVTCFLFLCSCSTIMYIWSFLYHLVPPVLTCSHLFSPVLTCAHLFHQSSSSLQVFKLFNTLLFFYVFTTFNIYHFTSYVCQSYTISVRPDTSVLNDTSVLHYVFTSPLTSVLLVFLLFCTIVLLCFVVL